MCTDVTCQRIGDEPVVVAERELGSECSLANLSA